VDQDPATRSLLQRELGAAGYEVDTLSSGNGFTEDMVELVHPDVLLVDPFMPDLPLAAVEDLLRRLRKDQQLVLLLIDGGKDPERLTRVAETCQADGRIERRALLAAPASAVGDQLVPESSIEAELIEVDLEDDLQTAQTAQETGEEIVLEDRPPPQRHPSPIAASPKPARHVPTRPDLLSMIAEELEERPPQPPPTVKTVHVEINLFSRHNFYVGSSGDLASGGVFVATSILPALGSSVPLQLEVPFLPPLTTSATVEWVRPSSQMGRVAPGVGLSLRHLPEPERRELERFFQERAPLTYLPNRGP
jgi:CheY-like chemotaxis protein/Tfp pilus assembly protein PilZ